MGYLSNLVIPVWVKPVGILLALVIFAGSLYGYGRHAQKVADQIIFDKMTLAAQKQQIEAKQKEVDQNEVTNRLKTTLTADAQRLRANLDKLRQRANASSSVPSTADSTSQPDAENGQRSGTCTSDQFYGNALMCELQLKGFRDFVIEQKLPIK